MAQGGLASKPGPVCSFRRTPIRVEPAIDLFGIRAVIGDRGLNESEGQLEVIGGGAHVTAVVLDDLDHLPHVKTRPDQARSPTSRCIDKADEGVVVHPESLFNIALGERAGWHATTARAFAESSQGGVGQSDAERLCHV